VLDRSHIVAMLRDPAFFRYVPEFTYLQDSITAATAAAVAADACETCGDGWRYFRPVADAFVLKLLELLKDKDPAVKAIRSYLGTKKRYDIGRVLLYYRGSSKGQIQKITF